MPFLTGVRPDHGGPIGACVPDSLQHFAHPLLVLATLVTSCGFAGGLMYYRVRQGIATCVVGLAATLLGSCGWTDLVSSKRNPAYSGPELKRLMVIGASADFRVRRVFEDEFVAKLKAAGIAAQPS